MKTGVGKVLQIIASFRDQLTLFVVVVYYRMFYGGLSKSFADSLNLFMLARFGGVYVVFSLETANLLIYW